jgi:hypothetical protein
MHEGQYTRRLDEAGDIRDAQIEATGRDLTEFRHDVLGHFDDIYRRFERLEQEYQTVGVRSSNATLPS